MEEEITPLSFDGLNQSIENLKKILAKKDLLMDKLMDKIIKQESEVIKVKNQCKCNFEVEKIRLESSLEYSYNYLPTCVFFNLYSLSFFLIK